MKLKEMINQVIQGDCLKIMKDIPDNSIDLVLTDPPYGINQADWDKYLPIKWVDDIIRILKDSGAFYIFGDSLTLSKLQIAWEEKLKWKGRATWIYEDGPRNSKNWTSKHEDCLYYFGEKHQSNIPQEKSKYQDKRWGDYRYIGNVWQFDRILGNNDNRFEHPTQKPIKLIEMLVKASSKENDLILDPFLGSGTTAVACQNLKRRFIGIEISKEYCEIARQRLRQKTLI